MAVHNVTNPEPLTLYTKPGLSQIYDRREILRQRELGSLPRLRVDPYIAKVLPANSQLSIELVSEGVVRVVACEYKPFFRKELYALGALVEEAPPRENRERPLPGHDVILKRLLEREGTPYLFGGSAPEGSSTQAETLIGMGLFEPEDRNDPELRLILESSGIDCSGLFNYATDYHFFGDSEHVYAVFQEGLTSFPTAEARDPEKMASLLQPLDLIVFRGHVLMALPEGRVIQAVGDGVNANTFCIETGYEGHPWTRYNRVVIDDAVPILRALIDRQGRRYTADWHLDDQHLMVVRL